MNEDRLKHLEEKIDLLYKILLNKRTYDEGYPYGFKRLNNYINEIALIFNIQVKKDTKLRQKIFSRLEKDYRLSKKECKKIESKLESEDLNENAKEKALVELQDKEQLFKKWHTRFENKELLIKKIENLNQFLDNFEIYKKFIEKVGAKGSSISGEVNTKIKGIYREFDFSDREFKNFLKNSNLQTLLKKITTFLGDSKK